MTLAKKKNQPNDVALNNLDKTISDLNEEKEKIDDFFFSLLFCFFKNLENDHLTELLYIPMQIGSQGLFKLFHFY